MFSYQIPCFEETKSLQIVDDVIKEIVEIALGQAKEVEIKRRLPSHISRNLSPILCK